MVRVSVLPYKKQLVFVCQRRDADSAGMIDNLSLTGLAFRCLRIVDMDFEYPAVIYVVAL